VSVTVTNTGSRPGKDAVLLFSFAGTSYFQRIPSHTLHYYHTISVTTDTDALSLQCSRTAKRIDARKYALST
jgi:hypothetical protein